MQLVPTASLCRRLAPKIRPFTAAIEDGTLEQQWLLDPSGPDGLVSDYDLLSANGSSARAGAVAKKPILL